MTEIGLARKQEIASEYEQLRIEGESEDSAADIVCAKYDIDRETLFEIVDEVGEK